MNILLIFFALPVATIILAIVLQKILDNPLLVAATFFAIYLIVTFAVFDASFLVFAIIYTILAYITAVLTRLICRLIKMLHHNCTCRITERPLIVSNTNLSNDNTNLVSETNSTNSSNDNASARSCCSCRCMRR
ncbi:MAG: YbeF family protein [Clostridia bacterium]